MGQTSATTPAQAKPGIGGTKLGDCVAGQPLSGITRIDETYAVNGRGRGGVVRSEETGRPKI